MPEALNPVSCFSPSLPFVPVLTDLCLTLLLCYTIMLLLISKQPLKRACLAVALRADGYDCYQYQAKMILRSAPFVTLFIFSLQKKPNFYFSTLVMKVLLRNSPLENIRLSTRSLLHMCPSDFTKIILLLICHQMYTRKLYQLLYKTTSFVHAK